jgi:hypothetical protein
MLFLLEQPGLWAFAPADCEGYCDMNCVNERFRLLAPIQGQKWESALIGERHIHRIIAKAMNSKPYG